MEAPRFTVVIVAHRRADLLRRTLESLRDCHLPDGFQGTLVIENGDQCGCEEAVRDASPDLRVTYEFTKSPIKSASLNLAIRCCPSQWLVFFDDDVRVDPRVLLVYAQAMRRYPEGHYLGGWTGVDAEGQFPHWLEPFLPASAKGFSPYPSPPAMAATRSHDSMEGVPCKHFLGFNWCVRSADLVACGGFDERLGPGTSTMIGDEGLTQLRLHLSGLQGLYISEARVWHYVPASRRVPPFALRRARPGGFMRAVRTGLENAAQGRSPTGMWADAWTLFRRRSWPALRRNPLAFLFVLRFQWLHARGYLDGLSALSTQQWTTDPPRFVASLSESLTPTMTDTSLSPRS